MAGERVAPIADGMDMVDGVRDHDAPDCLTSNAERMARQVRFPELSPGRGVIGPLSHDPHPDCPLPA
jgi:hypothetical protein